MVVGWWGGWVGGVGGGVVGVGGRLGCWLVVGRKVEGVWWLVVSENDFCPEVFSFKRGVFEIDLGRTFSDGPFSRWKTS